MDIIRVYAEDDLPLSGCSQLFQLREIFQVDPFKARGLVQRNA